MKSSKFVTSVAASTVFLSLSAHALADDGAFSDLSLGVGAFVFVGPVYEGSDEYKVGGLPFAFPIFGSASDERSRVSFRSPDDVRLSVLRRGGFDVGPVVGYSFGREQSDSVKLGGLGNVEGGVVLGGFASFTSSGFFGETAFSTQVSGGSNNGFVASIGGGYEMPITDRLRVKTGLSAEYASNEYMDRYFGITVAQSAASTQGYAAFDPGAGFKNVSINTSLRFDANEKLSLLGNFRYSRLVGDAANSPISVSDNQFGAGLGFIYRF